MRQPLIDVPIISAEFNITAGAYNRNIDKRLARKLVWLRETTPGVGHPRNFYHENYFFKGNLANHENFSPRKF